MAIDLDQTPSAIQPAIKPISRIPAVIPMNEHPGTRVIPTTLPPPMQGGVIDQAVSPTPVNTPIVSDMKSPAKTDINNTPKPVVAPVTAPAVAPAVAPTVAPTPSITDKIKGVAGNAMDAIKNKAVDMYNIDSQGNPESPLEATTRRAGMAGDIIKQSSADVLGAIRPLAEAPFRAVVGQTGVANLEKYYGKKAGELGTRLAEDITTGAKTAAERVKEGVTSGHGAVGIFKALAKTSPSEIPADKAAADKALADKTLADKALADKAVADKAATPEATATQSVQPYRGVGKPVSTLDVTSSTGGTGKVQFADGRKLSDASMKNIQGVMKRESDPAFKARLAEQNAISERRMTEANAASNAPAQQQVQQIQQQQAPDYSGEVNELMSQMPSGSSTDSIGTMIANKAKRAGILAKVGALQNAQKMSGERASEANRLAAEQLRANTAAQTEQTRLNEARQDRLAGRDLEERKFAQGQENIEATRGATAAEREATRGYQQATLQQRADIAANTPRTFTINGEKVNATPAEAKTLQEQANKEQLGKEYEKTYGTEPYFGKIEYQKNKAQYMGHPPAPKAAEAEALAKPQLMSQFVQQYGYTPEED